MSDRQNVRPVRPRVLMVVFDPSGRSAGGRSLVEACGFNDPLPLTRTYVADLAEASGGYLRYEVVETVWVDRLPRKVDGFRYDAETFLRCWRAGRGWHEPDAVDYRAILDETAMAERVAAGELDELWLWGPPYAGFWESHMVGRGAYYCNSEPLELPSCGRRFVVMGFNYERGVGEMLENFGHRAESLLAHAFERRGLSGRDNAWERFTAYDLVRPGGAGCGTVHFAPNSRADYDWGNRTDVWSTCDAWPEYPGAPLRRRRVDCREWGGGDIRAHHKWWLGHLPRSAGETDGIANNWWRYAVSPL